MIGKVVPKIPDGLTLVTDLPQSDLIRTPQLKLVYDNDVHLYWTIAYLNPPELGKKTYVDNLTMRQAVYELADLSSSPEIFDLYRDICYWDSDS